jgi:serine/threonine-protein kinase
MAEVYKGKLLGNEGFEKPVVIKKLLPEHASNRELIKVFIGEARLAALLQHDNIAATYDFGQIEGDYFPDCCFGIFYSTFAEKDEPSSSSSSSC